MWTVLVGGLVIRKILDTWIMDRETKKGIGISPVCITKMTAISRLLLAAFTMGGESERGTVLTCDDEHYDTEYRPTIELSGDGFVGFRQNLGGHLSPGGSGIRNSTLSVTTTEHI